MSDKYEYNPNCEFLVSELQETLHALDFENNAPDCMPGTETEYREELTAELAGFVYSIAEMVDDDTCHPEQLKELSANPALSSIIENVRSSFWRLTGCELEPQTFKTSDGFTLRKIGNEWTDGDLTFSSGANGMPVDVDGEALDGGLT